MQRLPHPEALSMYSWITAAHQTVDVTYRRLRELALKQVQLLVQCMLWGLQAMAAGLPVIAVAAGGLLDIVTQPGIAGTNSICACDTAQAHTCKFGTTAGQHHHSAPVTCQGHVHPTTWLKKALAAAAAVSWCRTPVDKGQHR